MFRPSIRLAAGATAAVVSLAVAAPALAGRTPRPPAVAPKNVILFVVDGMGPEQVALGRAMKGAPLAVDQIPWQTKGSLHTDSLEGVTDSAAAATALASGVETNNGWLGMYPSADGSPISAPTVLELAEDRGKATGMISDSYITDATPGAFAAHVASRGQTLEVATQMAGQDMEFLVGGGLRQGSVGPLLGRTGVTYVDDTTDMQAYAASGGAGPVYGLFGSWNMSYNLDREEEGVAGVEPTLPQATSAALSVLSKDPDGFFLMVEGGLVDWAGHARDAASMGNEMIESDQAVQVAYDWAKNRTDTLILFTADHETGAFDMTKQTNVAALRGQTATTEYMWGRIQMGAAIKPTVKTFTGIDLTNAEVATIQSCGEHGISDVLATRWKVSWNGTCTHEGDHTSILVPIWAWGPMNADFAGTGYDNELVGRNLLRYVA